MRTTVNSPVESGYISLQAQSFIFGLLIRQLKNNYIVYNSLTKAPMIKALKH